VRLEWPILAEVAVRAIARVTEQEYIYNSTTMQSRNCLAERHNEISQRLCGGLDSKALLADLGYTQKQRISYERISRLVKRSRRT
jgi:hypothetical protein